MKKISWYEKYLLTLEESLTIKEIMNLRGVGQSTAVEIRKQAIEFCLMNNIFVGAQKTPTMAVLQVTGYSQEYYYNQMLKEAEVKKIVQGGELVHASV